ncbi:hypothetical protein [Azohydromonas australica]|uniref:hypothetical protein n=1 Tax=Azohydromonas australica TaxID=364039 RepID=UPI00040DC1BC|nr:hypothetical protein [Azohydromonas australica]
MPSVKNHAYELSGTLQPAPDAMPERYGTSLSKALGMRLGGHKGNLKTLGDGLVRQLASVCGWVKECFDSDFELSPIPAAGEPVDHGFRWAEISWTPMSQYQWGKYDITGWMVDEVVTFLGWVNDSGDAPGSRRFGATASCVLQPGRMAPSVSGRWISAPVVSLSGTISGRARPFSVWQPLANETAARCSMVCRQSIFQVDLENSNPVLLAEKEEMRMLFSHENGGIAEVVLPGIQAMPAVDFEIKRANADVVVELGLSFELTVKGDDSRISFNDDPVKLAFRPWEPVAY